MQTENGLQLIVCQNEKFSKCANKNLKIHKKSRIMSPIPSIMSFSSETCTDRDLLKSLE